MTERQKSNQRALAASFRDPSGFLFWRNDVLYRQINRSYKNEYEKLMDSGLYKSLTDRGLLIPHEEVTEEALQPGYAYKVIRPKRLGFVSYPFEWCFSQLQDAAVATLQVQKEAFAFGMSLKDSSAYNIQFHEGRPIFIDTLSFEAYEEGAPWIAYRQFCQHFLAPLALMSYRDIRLGQLLRIYIDGIPLDLASALMPFRTRLSFSLFSHIHAHAKFQKHFAAKSVKQNSKKMSRLSLLGLLDNLESCVKGLKWRPTRTEWGEYYEKTNYTKEALQHKKQLVAAYLRMAQPKRVWDLGANTGFMSRIASGQSIPTVAFDADPAAVEKNYKETLAKGEQWILPLVLDLTNPSPGIGWGHEERQSLVDRGPVDAVLALALIHHLAISNNLPFGNIARFLHRISDSLIIEFVPKSDSNVQRLLATRKDIFANYTQERFEMEFGQYFYVQASEKIKGSERILYLMKKKTTV